MMIKTSLLLIALLSGKYKIQLNLFPLYNICTLLNRQVTWIKKDFDRARNSSCKECVNTTKNC